MASRVFLEKRKRKKTGKKYIAPTVIRMIIITDSGMPRLASCVLKVERNRLVVKPATISNPRKIKPSTERNVVHFLVEFRSLRISDPISIFLSS
jgi:hypothetical protein